MRKKILSMILLATMTIVIYIPRKAIDLLFDWLGNVVLI